MNILGIDIGTTGICGVLLDSEKGSVIESVSLPNKSFIETDVPFEKIQDTEIIMSAVNEIIGKIRNGIDCIGISGQMHGVVYTDSEGNAVSPLYIWQDYRGAEQYKDGQTYAGYLGCYPGYGLATAFYNEVNGLVPETAAGICTIGDYVGMKLCSCRKAVMHVTNAASLGCFDLENNRFGIDNPMLPEVTTEFMTIGYFRENIPVCVAIGDNQASFIGSVPDNDGVLLNVGTGAQISYLTDELTDTAKAEFRPFDGKRFLVAGCSLCGGRAFAIFEKFCREIAKEAGAEISSYYPVLDRILSAENDSGITADCRFCGTRADPACKGGFSGITESNFTLKNFAFAVLDGIIDELYGMYEKSGNVSALVCSGNGFRKNPALLDSARRLFGSEPCHTVYEEEAAVGAAFAAGVACGAYKDIDEARKKIILA